MCEKPLSQCFTITKSDIYNSSYNQIITDLRSSNNLSFSLICLNKKKENMEKEQHTLTIGKKKRKKELNTIQMK